MMTGLKWTVTRVCLMTKGMYEGGGGSKSLVKQGDEGRDLKRLVSFGGSIWGHRTLWKGGGGSV